MYSASDLRKGLRIELDGSPYVITEFNFVKPGKGAAIYTCKLKNLVNGSTMTRAYRDNAEVGEPKLEEKRLRFSYVDGANYVFQDENYEEVLLSAETLGERRLFLMDDMEVVVLFHNDKAIDIQLPFFIEKRIIHTEPGARGDTANNVLKPATVEGGYQVQVPLFVNLDDVIRIDTRTGEYADRVSKK